MPWVKEAMLFYVPASKQHKHRLKKILHQELSNTENMGNNDAAMSATNMAPTGYANQGASRGGASRPSSRGAASLLSDDDTLSVSGLSCGGSSGFDGGQQSTPQPSKRPPVGVAAGTLPPCSQQNFLPPAGLAAGTLPPGQVSPCIVPQHGVAGGVAGAGGGVEPSGGAAGGVTGAGDVSGGGGGVDPKDKARLERQAGIHEAKQARKDSAAAARQREKEAADAAKVTPKGKAGTWLKGAQNIIVDLTGHKAQCGPPLAPEMVTMYTGIFEKRMKEVSTLRNNLQELLECTDANADEMVNRELHNAGLLAGNIKT